jgi:hypothetical protein
MTSVGKLVHVHPVDNRVREPNMRMGLSLAILLLALAAIALSGCGQAEQPKQSAPDATADSPNRKLLAEVNQAQTWLHAKKTRPIWARRLEAAQTVKTLEGEEQVAAGHYLCKGEAGDIWPQTEKDLLKRYAATDEVDADGWRKYEPHPDAQGVLAAPINHAFEVQATWGKLTGKPGDFLVKNFQDRDTPYPADIWIVDQTLFRQTYETLR